jgi:hypothetical protein
MSFSSPEFFDNTIKKFQIGFLEDNRHDNLVDLNDVLFDEICRNEDDILQSCYQGLPLGYKLCLNVFVDYIGEWQFAIKLKLVECVINVGVKKNVIYIFDIVDVNTPDFLEEELWDENEECWKIQQINELCELTTSELIIFLLGSRK